MGHVPWLLGCSLVTGGRRYLCLEMSRSGQAIRKVYWDLARVNAVSIELVQMQDVAILLTALILYHRCLRVLHICDLGTIIHRITQIENAILE